MGSALEELFNRGDYKGVIKEYKSMEKKGNARPEDALLAGKSYYRLGKFKDAIKQLSGFQDGPLASEAMLYIGKSYLSMRKFSEAEQSFRRSLDVGGDYFEGLLNMGIAQAEQKKYEDAEANLQRATELSPEDKRGWYNLGVTKFIRGNYQEAEACFLRALSIDPGFTEALYNLAATHCMMGKENEYRDDLAKLEAVSKNLRKSLERACKRQRGRSDENKK